MVRAGDVEGIEAWVARCIEEGPDYAGREEHRAMVESASPECKFQLRPLQIEDRV
jgi:hypothetical protein